MGSERTRLCAVRARAPRVAGVVLAGLGLVVGLSASPAAAATEGDWINEGGPARSADALDTAWYNGQFVEIARGEDNRIWWRYGNRPWRLMPGNARTHVRPEAVAYPIRGASRFLVVFHTGDDGFAYYSFLQDPNSGRWSGWSRVPGSLRTHNRVAASYSDDGLTLSTIVNDRIYQQHMDYRDGQAHFRADWERLQSPLVLSMDVTDAFTFTQGEQEFYAAKGLTNEVLVARKRRGDRNARFTELPGGARCESVAIGRGGDPAHLATSPFDPGYAAQQNMAIGCISPNDHQLYLNRSTDGGNNWSGWAHSSGGPSPSGAAPEIHGFLGGEVFAVLSWGSNTAPFKRHMMVMKRVM
ncbi:hypothetical protein [Streptomyces sp. NPDC056154]|uniref:hypothetical protein n=1 Tax=unclassified Streptomyces TaxID=2593676 RepID=UPI0035D8FC73